MIIKNIEVWKAGTTNDGRTITPVDIQQAYEGTVAVMTDGYQPVIKMEGHWQGGEKIDGTITACRLEGDSIFCDVSVSDELHTSLKENKLPYRSVEITKEFTLSSGEKVPQFISALAFLGTSIPAIHSLKPIFGSARGVECVYFSSELGLEIYKNLGGNMEYKELYERAESEKAALKSQNEAYQSKVTALETDNKGLKTQIEEQVKQISIFEADRKKSFFDSLVNGKRLMPGKREAAEKVFDSLVGTMGREEAEKQIETLFTSTTPLHTQEFEHEDSDEKNAVFSMASHPEVVK